MTVMRLIAFNIFLLMSPALLQSADEGLVLRSQKLKNNLLVLNSGRVVKGKLTPRTGGYDVTLPAGRIFVSSEQIRFKASDMQDAYQRMRDSMGELTPNSHVELAKWCLTNRLPSNARRELLDALHQDPYRADAKRMLEGLIREQQRSSAPPAVRRTAATQPVAERRSLGGLPQETARTFTRTIQPLIANKCGNARCHGPGQNSFTVVPLRNAFSAYTTEQNLAAVLNQISFDSPQNSPLLAATTGLHGGSRELFFRGQSGRRQLELLNAWVAEVAQEMSPVVRNNANTQSDSEDKVKVQSKVIHSAVPHGTTPNTADTDQKFITSAVAATRKDTFNPEIFNRRFHGAANAAVPEEQ